MFVLGAAANGGTGGSKVQWVRAVLQRVRELESMYHRLEDALEEERQARQDEKQSETTGQVNIFKSWQLSEWF